MPRVAVKFIKQMTTKQWIVGHSRNSQYFCSSY